MPQQLEVEIDGEDTIPAREVTKLKNFIETIATSDAEVSRIRLGIEAEQVLNVTMEQEREPEHPTPTTGNGQVENPERVETTETEENAPDSADGRQPTVNPDTRRWVLASLLYHSSSALVVGDVVEVSQDEDWEMNQSSASAELYTMYQERLVEREGSPYEYRLTEEGEAVLEQRATEESAEIEPNLF